MTSLTTSETFSPSPEGSRKCTRCGETKPVTDYHRDSRAPGGRSRRCKACRLSAEAERYSENRDAIRARVRQYRQGHGDDVRRQDRERYAADPMPKRRSVAKWQRRNPEVSRDKHHRRRAAQGASRLPRGYLRAMTDFYGPACLGCGALAPLTFDHVVPLARGGKHALSNGQLLCRSCNSAKGARRDTDYRDPARGILAGLSPEGPIIVYPDLSG